MGVAEPLIQATLLAEALENGPVAVFVVGDDCRHIAVNQYACTLLGYTREELLSISSRELGPEVGLDEQLTSALNARRFAGRSTLRRKDGSLVEIEFRAHEALVAGMPFFVSVGWPVSDD
jgi:two-component system, sensor histidine kinase PdtaS